MLGIYPFQLPLNEGCLGFDPRRPHGCSQTSRQPPAIVEKHVRCASQSQSFLLSEKHFIDVFHGTLNSSSQLSLICHFITHVHCSLKRRDCNRRPCTTQFCSRGGGGHPNWQGFTDTATVPDYNYNFFSTFFSNFLGLQQSITPVIFSWHARELFEKVVRSRPQILCLSRSLSHLAPVTGAVK